MFKPTSKRPFHLLVPLLIILLFVFAPSPSPIAVVVLVDAAQSRRRVVIRRSGNRNDDVYDRSITTFSQDGRLAQVEYGMEASLKGSSIAAAKLNRNNNKNSGVIIVLQNSSFGKIHRLDHHLFLVTSGLAGDARFLANNLRRQCQNHRLAYGEAPTTEQIAKVAGELQHELTRTGGARPLGCTAIVVGMDESSSPSSSSTSASGSSGGSSVVGETMIEPRLFSTDPGGIVEECSYCAAGNERQKVEKVLSSLLTKEESPNNKKWLFDRKKSTNNKNNNNKASSSKDTLSVMAATMAEKVISQFTSTAAATTTTLTTGGGGSIGSPTEDSNRADVWILRPNTKCRGCIQATCFQNIQKHSIDQIIKTTTSSSSSSK